MQTNRNIYYLLLLCISYSSLFASLLSLDHGASLTKRPSEHSSSSFSANYLNDLATDTTWLSQNHHFVNDAIFKFNDSFDEKTFKTFSLYNYNNGNYGVKEFALLISSDSNLSTNLGRAGWTRISSTLNTNEYINILRWIEGGIYQDTATQVDANRPASRMNDGDLVNHWISQNNKIFNEFDYRFDTDFDGNDGDTITFDQFNLYNYGDNTRSIKEFEIEVKINNTSWVKLENSENNTTFVAQKIAGLQIFDINDSPIENVTDIRIRTLSNYGDSYIGAKEFEIIGYNPNASHTFIAQKIATLQKYPLEQNLTNITDVRLRTLSNYGDSYIGAKEFEIIGYAPYGKHTFTAQKGGGWQTFNFKEMDASLFRLHTMSNYGASALGIGEIALKSNDATFNAVNKSGGCFNWDNNITTKVAGSNINLTILSADTNDENASISDANITKLELLSFSDIACENLYSATEIWNDNQKLNASACWNPPAFQHNRAVKCAKIRITGIFDGNIIESNSTDTFSIRPNKFILGGIPAGKLSAEKNYTFQAKAVNINGTTNSIDFNQSITPQNKKYFRDDSNGSDMAGDFLPITNFIFTDGATTSTTLNFNNVGKIGLELNDTTWAIVDEDDTPLIDRTIYLEQNLTFIPTKFDINFTTTPLINNHNGAPFTYYANDLVDMGANLKNLNFKITALGKNGGIMTNYQNPQATYYANNINITPALSIPNSPNYNPIPATQTDFNANFTSGVATITQSDIQFNFDRNHSQPIDPQIIQGNNTNFNIDIIEENADNIEGNTTSNFSGNAKFYYGRFRVQDIKTNNSSTSTNVIHEVYSSSNLVGYKQNTASWYVNIHDQMQTQLQVVAFNPRSTMKLDSTDRSSDTSISNLPKYILQGRATLDITTSSDKSFKTYYHIDIPKWLWYSRYNSYNFTVISDCSMHPCFEYIFQVQNDENNISSGDFNGAKFENNFNSGVKKKAIKLMR